MFVPLKNPSPDFESFKKVIKGEKEPERVHFVEVTIDPEIQKSIVENLMGEKWIPPKIGLFGFSSSAASDIDEEAYWKQFINFYYRMGYDFLPDEELVIHFQALLTSSRITEDTASLSRGKRIWAEEGKGMITSWEDFEKFP